ncbi:hypothetical protein MD484_g9037, partial [Candolleomyces efflorescens]
MGRHSSASAQVPVNVLKKKPLGDRGLYKGKVRHSAVLTSGIRSSPGNKLTVPTSPISTITAGREQQLPPSLQSPLPPVEIGIARVRIGPVGEDETTFSESQERLMRTGTLNDVEEDAGTIDTLSESSTGEKTENRENSGSEHSQTETELEHIKLENEVSLIRPHKASSAEWRTATFGAKDALCHIEAYKDNILEALGAQHTTAFVLAGFNEAYIREGIGLLQEIHIAMFEDLELDESAIVGVGKACSPFPSVIYMPSGKSFQPPLYDQSGQSMPLSVLGDSQTGISRAPQLT